MAAMNTFTFTPLERDRREPVSFFMLWPRRGDYIGRAIAKAPPVGGALCHLLFGRGGGVGAVAGPARPAGAAAASAAARALAVFLVFDCLEYDQQHYSQDCESDDYCRQVSRKPFKHLQSPSFRRSGARRIRRTCSCGQADISLRRGPGQQRRSRGRSSRRR